MLMSQASFFASPDAAKPADFAAQKRVQVLVPLPLARAYDYALPSGMDVQAGDYVSVPIGKREMLGVVWSMDGDAALDPAKVKHVLKKHNMPPMPPAQRNFIEWVSRYTMSDMGSVLKMCISVPEALEPAREMQLFTLTNVLPHRISDQRKKVIYALKDGVPRSAVDLARAAGCNPAVVRAMATAGQLEVMRATEPAPCQNVNTHYASVGLSVTQAEAAEGLRQLVAAKSYGAALLDGVTGSGKTEVYFEAVAAAVEAGHQALILLPEISLSAQFIERFEKRFGDRAALWHSEVTLSQKKITWRGVAEGRTKVVIGARSALFLPFAHLGLIVVDEEHETSYKQEEGVMYNARDMAVVRARLGHFPVVLVSATPSLETVLNADQGKYKYLHLPSRHAGAVLPDMQVVDLRTHKPERQRFISPPLEKALKETLEAGEQSILFLNRRGYAPLTLCRTCGHRFQCPSCSAWLVEHKRHQSHLQCHHCGYKQTMPKACPSCNDTESFVACGPGVERIQEEVQMLLPEARVMLLASDIITSAHMVKAAIREIEDQKIDIIVGTQIIAKGHHFPALTLVGVIDADLGLAGGDLRAGERTFQLLHQVAGRAGRGEKKGRVLIQTYMPEQQVIRALAGHNRDAFLQAEGRERERTGMPPHGKLAALILSGPDEQKLEQFCRALAQAAPCYDDIRVLGPAPAPLAYLRGKHRRRFLVKAARAVAVQKFIEGWLDGHKVPSNIQLKIDIDPQSFY